MNIELHTHLEGSITPQRLRLLAERHGHLSLCRECLNAEGTAYEFSDFEGFLDIFGKVTLLLRTPADFHAVALDLGRQLARDEIQYAEVMLSYGVMLKRGIDPLPVQQVLAEAAAEIEESQGVIIRWIPDAVRQWGLDQGWRAWECAAKAGRQLGVVGFGLGGDEALGPAREFAPLFADVKVEGLGVTIHAGEMPSMGAQAAADSVRQAVEECGADRIGHGLAAVDSPLVMGLLAARQIFVELCPTSNVCTGAIESISDHPLQNFLAAGVPCSFNTDDRTVFGSDLRQEAKVVTDELGVVVDQMDLMQAAAWGAVFSSDISRAGRRHQ